MPAKGKTFDPLRISKAVKDAGFTAGEVVVTASGTLVRDGAFLRLNMGGSLRPFVLAGGAKADQLSRQADLLAKRVRVTGKLHASHADKPPGITVEGFEVLDL